VSHQSVNVPSKDGVMMSNIQNGVKGNGCLMRGSLSLLVGREETKVLIALNNADCALAEIGPGTGRIVINFTARGA
jgi:hypothetical protein